MRPHWKRLGIKVLGDKFDLSTVFAGDQLMENLNKKYRKKTGTCTVLSFSLSDTQGEIFINEQRAKKEALKLKISDKDYLDYLFIHSLLHLKGYEHGKKMEQEEKKLIEKFKINITI